MRIFLVANREEEAAARRRSQLRTAGWIVATVLVIIVFLVLAKLVSNSGPSSSGNQSGNATASPALMSKLTSIAPDVYAKIGQGSATNPPKAISGAPALTQGGKPEVLYVGAEYCPYCAAERWPMVIALSRFGSFSNLQTTHSSSSDAFPDTQTFSFHGASYSSQYLSFVGVETMTNQPQGNSYGPLDSLSADQQSLMNTYDAPPYVSASSSGAIPFVDFGGKYVLSGSTYKPDVLQGKSLDDIAGSLSDTGSDISKGAIGSANLITATICKLTNNQPGNVCGTSVIQGLESQLGQ